MNHGFIEKKVKNYIFFSRIILNLVNMGNCGVFSEFLIVKVMQINESWFNWKRVKHSVLWFFLLISIVKEFLMSIDNLLLRLIHSWISFFILLILEFCEWSLICIEKEMLEYLYLDTFISDFASRNARTRILIFYIHLIVRGP